MQTTPIPPAALERVRKLIASGQRKILGIAAAPGAGKSTLAQGLRQAFGSAVQVLPMDGFHLANSELQRLGRAGRKGAPDTFDAEGYVHLLHRLRQQQAGQTIYAPDFRREIEEAVAGAIALEASTPLIVTEGNYLLLQDGAWQQVRTALDEAWYLELEPALRQQRLLARHMQFGRSKEAALQWIAHTDEPNAQRIEGTRTRADWILSGH